MFLRTVACLLTFAVLIPAQTRRVDRTNIHERVICVVPMVGAGTPADPKRPQYAPWPPSNGRSQTDIIEYSYQMTDDGRFAIVEFVARDRKAFQAILNDATIKKFEKGRDRKEDIERELKELKKDFDLSKLGAVRP